MARWIKGESGNRRGRPRKSSAIAGLARHQIEKHKLIEKLGNMGARQGDYSGVEFDQQLRAIQLLLSYGYGPPRPEIEASSGTVIQVVYEQRNQIALTSAAPLAIASDRGSQTLQRGLLRPALGQDLAGGESAD